MKLEHIIWSQQHFRMLADRGTWAVPKNGLVFQKQGAKLVLIMRMPHDPAMPISAAELREYQDEGYQEIKEHFEAAGIPVEKETN